MREPIPLCLIIGVLLDIQFVGEGSQTGGTEDDSDGQREGTLTDAEIVATLVRERLLLLNLNMNTE
jgi:hypothetical protein